MASNNLFIDVKNWLLYLQQMICVALENIDGKCFLQDDWQRSDGVLKGEGSTRLIEEGNIFERGGCNFSEVHGQSLPAAATVHRPHLVGVPFSALGVSLVLHPRNPYIPTVHFNIRMLQAQAATGNIFWLGGGMDLTPYYGYEEDARHFHQTCKKALDTIDSSLYSQFKSWCDDYFFLKHRQEPRGIGGIFFDDYVIDSKTQGVNLMRAVGEGFLPAYLPIVDRRKNVPYGKRERDFQSYRRGRYVEFNLIWDRGTLFGLQSGGRTESILMSMPPLAQWRYQWQPEVGSPEAKLTSDFLKPRSWIN